MAFDNLKKIISGAAQAVIAKVAAEKPLSSLGQTVKAGVTGANTASTVHAPDITVKLPQVQSARQKMLFQEEEQEKWYRGDQPTTSEILARIYTVSQDNPTEGEQLWNTFQTFQNDPSSPVYNPYTRSTNKAAVELSNLGFDMSGGITQKWLEENAWLKNHYRTVTGTTPLAPSSSSTREQNAAYWYYKAMEAEETTERAETEWAALQEEIKYWTGRSDRNYSDEEVLARIDWSKYPTLVRMDEDRQKGTPTVLNRSIGYSQDALYGVVWAARNESTGDPMMDSIKAALGYGNTWQEDTALAARLDPTNAAYSPYAAGSTIDDAALYFGVSEFPSDWLENNRAYLNSGDATAKQMYQQVYDAEQTTLTAEAELESMWDTVDEWMKYTTDPDVILSGLLDEYPTLQKMDKSRKSGDLLATTRAIDYRWEDVEAEVRRRCEAVNTAKQGGEFTTQIGDVLGLSLPHSESDLALEKSRDNAINAGAATIMAQGTDEEKSVFQTAYSSNFDTYLVEINTAMNNGVTDPQGSYAYCLDRANEYTIQHYLAAKSVVAPYEAKQQEVSDALEEMNTLNSQLWVQQEQHIRNENEPESDGPAQDRYHAMVSVDGSDWELQAERIEGTNQYRFIGAYNTETGEFLDPIPGVMSAALSVKGEMFAESLNPKEETVTTEKANYTPEEQEVILARVKELEDSIVSGNAYLESNAQAYANSQQIMQQIDSGYAAADRMAALAGLEKSDSTSTKDALDFVYAFGAEYKPTEWTTQDLYTAALEQGYDFTAVAQAAATGKQENENAIDQINYTLEWLEKNGVAVDQTYLDNMQRERARLEREVKAADYFMLQGNEDFASVVADTSAKVKRPIVAFGTTDDLLAYYAVHPLEDVSTSGSSATWMPSMTDHERQTYLYLYGKESPEAAREYYDYLTNSSYGVVPVRATVTATGALESMAHDLPITSSVLSIISSPLQLSGIVYSGYAALTDQEINPYHRAFGTTQLVGTIRETVKSDNLDRFGVAAPFVNFLYDAGVNAGDSFVNAQMFGGLGGTASLSLGGAASTIQNVKLRGGTDDQALLLGGITAVVESLTESRPMENLNRALLGGDTVAARNALLAILQNAGVEGLGEVASSLVSNISDAFIMGEYEKWKNSSPEEQAQATKDFVISVLYEGAVGTFSGGASMGMATAVRTVKHHIAQHNTTLPATESTSAEVAPAIVEIEQSDDNFPLMTDTFGPDAIEAQQNAVLARQMAALSAAMTTADEASITATIGAALAPAQGTVQNTSMASSVAQRMVSGLGAAPAVTLVQDTLLTAAESGVTTEQAQMALTTAVLAPGQAQQVLADIVANSSMNSENLANLIAAAQVDMQDNALMQQLNQAVTDNQVATRVAAIVAEGGLEGITSYETAVQQARTNLQNAQDALEQMEQQQTVAAENLQSTYAQFAQEPGNQQLRGAAQQAIKDAEGAVKVVAEYQQSLTNAETALQGAETTLAQVQDSTLRKIRQQAQAEVIAATEQATQQSAEQAYQDAITILNPTVPFGQMLPLQLKDGSTVQATGFHSYHEGSDTYFYTTSDGSVISGNLLETENGVNDPTLLTAGALVDWDMDAVMNRFTAPTVPLDKSVPVIVDATGEVVQVIGFTKDINGQANYMLADGSSISAWDSTPANSEDIDYLGDIYSQNQEQLSEPVQVTEETAETQAESEDNSSVSEDDFSVSEDDSSVSAEEGTKLKDWQEPQYHGKPKALRKLRTNTASFQKWFNDPSGDLTNPDGTPRIIFRGTHSTLYMEHQAGKHSGQVINFYTPDLAIAQSYAAGSSHKIKTYDIVNWETAAKAMEAEGFELREVQKYGEWGYQAFGVETATQGTTGDFYRENELNRFNKEYGGIQRAGLYEGYISIKNPLVIDAHGAPFTSTHATVKDKNGNDYTATMKNRYWGEWAAQNGYDACIIRNSLDYLSGNTPGKKPGTVIMTFNSASFKSKYNTGKLGKTNPDIRYHKAGTFALTGEPISQQMQDITKRLAAGQMVDVADIMATPEVQWAEAHQLTDSSIPYREKPYTAEEMAELVSPERASLQQDIQEELMALGSALIDKNGETQYTGPVKQEKMLDIVIGPPAAGKSSALADPISQLHGSRILDSDMVKERLPEYQGGLNSGYLHNESRHVWTQMQQAAIQAGDNVVLPIVGHNYNSVLKSIQPYLDAGYTVQVHYLELEGSKTLGRALNRFLTDGRYIDPAYLAQVSDGRITQVYEQLKEGGLIDEYSHWSNDVPRGEKPTRIEGSALQHLHGGAGLVADNQGDGGQGKGGTPGQTGAGDNQSQVRKTLKYSKNTPQQQPQGVSSTPKGAPKVSPAKIAKGLVKTLGLGEAIGTKRMNRVPQAVQGYYETRAKYIAVRSNQAGNYTVTMHEVFHNLAERLNMTGTQDMVNNLDPVFAASYDPVELPGEAFAEFGWRYMENESLARQFAGDAFVDQFEARLRQAGLHKPVHDAARQLRIWLNATVNERIGATIVDKSRAAKPGSLREQFRTLISQYIDDTAAAEPVNAAIRKATGQHQVPLNQDVRANALMKNFAGRRAYAILTENLTDANWNIIGESLAARFERVGMKAKDAKLLNEYMLALHSLDRDAQDKPVFDVVSISPAQRQQLIDDVQQNHPEVAAAEKEFQAFRKEFLQAFLVDTGFLDQADFDAMNTMYPHYVPTFRVKNGRKANRGKGKTYQIKRATGSTEDIINPMDSFVSMVDSIVTMVSANNAALAWDNAYRQNEGLGAFGREITPDMRQVSVNVSELQSQIAQLLAGHTDGDVFQQVIDLVGTRQTQWVPQAGTNMANVVTVQRADGSLAYYEMFEPELYKLLASQRDGSGSSNKLWATLGKITRAMSMLTTGSNPVFATRNFMRDFQNSVNYGSWASNYGTGLIKWLRASYDVWRRSGEFQDYVALGGGGWTRIEAGTKKGINAYRSALYAGYNTSSVGNAAKWAGQKIWNTLTFSRLNEVIEQTSRFAEYKYGKHDKTTSEGRARAFLAAQDVTVDFARMGNSGTASVLKQLIPFLGASTQGVYRTGRAITQAERGRSVQRFTKTVINTALASAISVATILKFSDDEEKEAFALMSDDLKSQHLYFPNFAKDVLGQQPLIRIPLAQDPLTYAIHGAMTNAIWSGTTDEMVIDLASIANTIVDNLNPFGNGTIFEPLLAVTRNKNWYGSRIVPGYMSDWDVSTQYTEETPGLFVAAGRALNMSPLNLQYLAEQYSGFLGQMAVPALSKDEAGNLGGLEATIAAVQKRFTSDPLISNDVIGCVYDNASFLTQVTAAAKNNRPANMLRRGLSDDELKAAYQEAYDLTHKGGAIAEAKTFLSEGYDRIDEINANDSLSPEQKYTLTSDVRREMIEVALEANEAAAAYNEKYVAGLNIATNALYEGAYLSIPTAMDRLDQTFKADSDQTYMQQATSVWEATGDDSALPHPNTSYTVSGVTYTVSEEDMDNWLLQYKIGYQEYLVEKGKHWDSLTDEEKLEILKNAHSAGHNTAKSWHMKLHGIK